MTQYQGASAPVSQDLLRSRLWAPPATGLRRVTRTRLLAALDAVPDWRVLVLQAPAGYGKTTLMAQLFQRWREAGGACRWLTLETTDDDANHLTAHLLAALQTTGDSSHAAEALSAQRPDDLAAGDMPRWLFLDEVECLRTPEALRVLDRLLRFGPSNLRLVVGSRPGATLDINRLRASGELVEWSARELRFDAAETEVFLQLHDTVGLAAEGRAWLAERCEGWPALLGLGVLALRHPGMPSGLPMMLSESGSHLAEYLSGEVLERLPPAQQAFLLRTSLLPELRADLCQVVCESPEQLAVFAELGRRHRVAIPVDDIRPGVYRYPTLLRDFLQARLLTAQPALALALHRRVAQAFAGAQDWMRAVEHALSTGDPAFAAEMMQLAARPMVKAGHLATVQHWTRRLPAHLADAHHDIVWAAGRAHTYFYQIESAEARLRQLFALASRRPENAEALEDCLALEALILAAVEDTQRLDEVLEHHLRRATGDYALGIMVNLQAAVSLIHSQFDQSLTQLDLADHHNRRAANLFGMSATRAVRAAVWATQGQLRRAQASFGEPGVSGDAVTARAGDAGLVSAAVAAKPAEAQGASRRQYASVGSGVQVELLYEADELDTVRSLLALYNPAAEGYLSMGLTVGGHLTASRLAQAAGRADQALALLEESLAHATHRRFGRMVLACQWEKVRVATLAGDLEQAAAWAAAATPWPRPSPLFYTTDTEAMDIAALRLAIRRGEASRVLPEVRTAAREATRLGRGWRALKLAILHACALRELGRSGQADDVLAAALQSGAREGFVRTFADEGEPVLQTLQGWLADQALPEGVTPAYLWRILRAGGVRHEAKPGKAALAEAALSGEGGGFNARERELLQALANGSRNRELAEVFKISENTVKWYLKNLYLKLEARNRAEVILKARRQGLIR